MWGVCLKLDATISHKRIFSHRTFQDCTSKELFCTWKWRTSSIWCRECYFNHCYHIWQWNHTWNPGSYCFDLYVTDENNYIYPSFSAAKWRYNRFWFRCRRRLNHLTNILLSSWQATIAPPVKGKMFKGLCVCYAVVLTTFFSVAISGYWAFGNQAKGTVVANFMVDEKALLPSWVLLMTNVFIFLQVSAVSLVSGLMLIIYI